jgi:hypothetical protein
MRPETTIPGSVTAEALLASTETAAVAVGSLRAYPNGFEFTVHVRQRRDDEDFIHGLSDPFGRHPRRSRGAEPDQSLRLGILYADGRRAAIGGAHPPLPGQVAPDELVLMHGGSRGSDRRWDGDFWVHPLPPDGPVTFVVSWLAKGITEARAQVNGGAISAAASRAMELWPDDPESEPTSGWSSSTVTAVGPDPATPPAGPGPEDTSA